VGTGNLSQREKNLRKTKIIWDGGRGSKRCVKKIRGKERQKLLFIEHYLGRDEIYERGNFCADWEKNV
jgi:hypothetical protein